MPRENFYDKGTRLLAEARVTIDTPTRKITATVRGTDRYHSVTWDPSHGWHCTCPALTTCSHLSAVQRVTVIPGTRP
jgi:uncharacterized Zn finger protein